jgi:hypothetical protein
VETSPGAAAVSVATMTVMMMMVFATSPYLFVPDP